MRKGRLSDYRANVDVGQRGNTYTHELVEPSNGFEGTATAIVSWLPAVSYTHLTLPTICSV
eukprot:12246455-Alexandrium_andersonii.AAC.1